MRLFILLFFLTFSFPVISQNLVWKSLDVEGEPLARHENALVAAGRKMILIGGREVKPLNIYDPENRTWSEGATPPFEIHHMQAVTLDGLVYILGAFTGSWPNETPLTHVLIYDVATDTWTIGPEIPANRRRGAAGVVTNNNRIYMVNGIINGHASGWVNWLDEYDPYTGSWKTLTSSPQPRDHFQAAVIDDKLYVAGGRRSGSTESGFEGTVAATNVYDFKTKTWKVLPDIPTQRAGTAATVYDNKYVVIGGESGSQETSHKEVEAFDPVAGEWTSLPSLKIGRHGTQAITAGEFLIIGSGSGNRGGGPELTSFEILSALEDDQLKLPALKKDELQVLSKEINFSKDSAQEDIIITNPGKTAIVIPYLQLDNQKDFSIIDTLSSPLILAPGSRMNISVKKLGGKENSSATLFIKSAGDAAPIEVKISG